MASEFDIKLSRRAIEKLTKSGEIKKGLEVLGGVAERKAKELVPVLTGNLRRSITHEVGQDSKGWFMRFGTNVFYGIYQELGTRFHPAQPFLRPVLSHLAKFIKG